jgi:hypothetical protein
LTRVVAHRARLYPCQRRSQTDERRGDTEHVGTRGPGFALRANVSREVPLVVPCEVAVILSFAA